MSYEEIRSNYPIARKQHRCEWCNEVILVKEKHFHRVYNFDCDFHDGRMHLECEAAMNKVDLINLLDGWCPGDYKRGMPDCL